MDFFSSLFIAIASFFGFGQPEVEVVTEPVVVIEEVGPAAEVLPVSSSISDDIQVSIEEEDEQASLPVVESQDLEATDNMSEGQGSIVPTPALVPDVKTMIVAGGCFWCVEADLEKTNGVIEVVSGYSGGEGQSPTYKSYSTGGHREVVEVTYDANEVSFEDILIVTMKTTDPTDDDGTFGDRGDKYSITKTMSKNKS